MKKILLGFGVSILLFGCQQVSDGPASGEPVKIGAIAPLTGDTAAFGEIIQTVSHIILEETNTNGGIHGRPLEIVLEDGKCTPADASRSAQKLIGVDKVSVIFGGVCSGETLAAAPITERNKVILFSPVSTSPEVTKAGDFVFRSSPSDSTQGLALAEYANAHFKNIGILTEQTDYALGVANVFVENYTGNIVREDFLSSESDFKTRITKLKSENIEALFINPQSAPKFEIILKQLQEQEWNTPLLVNEIAAGNAESAVKFSEFLIKNKTVGANFVVPQNPAFQDFLKKYNALAGKDPEYLNYTATTHDGLLILIDALKKVDDLSDTAGIRDALYATKNFPGFTGSISVDTNGDVNISYSLFEFNGTEFVPLAQQ